MAQLARLIDLYAIVVFIRIILSWFPISRGSPMETVYSVLYNVTEPVLGPVRRALPPMGGFDLSPMIVIIGLELLANAVR
ncbi:MAG TPA: YggT family protein [Acidimicrobiales bacterium]|nr:YggT family protein [Acidimicrobiales bacterium]